MADESVGLAADILAGWRELSAWEQAGPAGPGWRQWNRAVDRLNRLIETAVVDPIALGALQEIAKADEDPAVRRWALEAVRPNVPQPDSVKDLERWLNNPLVNLGQLALEPHIGIALTSRVRAVSETDATVPDLDIDQLTWLLGEPSGQDLPWPRRSDGTPLAHVAQIELTDDLSVQRAWPHLPLAGVLQFFHDLEAIGDDVADGHEGAWLVRYLPDRPVGLVQRPADLTEAFRPRWVAECIATWTFPSPLDLDLPEAEFERLELATARVHDTVSTRWGMQEGAEFLDLPIMLGYGAESTREAVERLESVMPLHSADDRYVLLLDVPGTGPFEGWVGDMGHLEFWIRETDLEARRFEAAWALLR